MRWTKQGTLQKREYDVYYSCHEREHILGTAFIVHKRLKHLVIGFKPISPRLSVLRIKGRFFNIRLINVHAPTEDKSDVEKDEFYSALEDAYDKCPKNDIKIIVGDFNAKIGRESRYQPHVDKYSLHKESNENRDKAIGFAASKNMIIGSTKFNHKDVHKLTWVSPDGQNNESNRPCANRCQARVKPARCEKL
ncbi:craniofacial development protein 2-like [Temnothorax longispinosus]|uniref:craniofacial development protein 2-like n=1 Tax=Temnothorax longispinosus TaxID=300112 RepID=UPI003A99AC5A